MSRAALAAWWARTWPTLLAVVVVTAIGAPAAVASYRHARDVVASTGDEVMAPWLPLSVDGLLVAALVVIWVRRHRGEAAGWGPWAAFGFGMLATIAANLAAVREPSGRAYAVALFPPVALAVTLELVAMLAARTALRAEAGPVRAVAEQLAVPAARTKADATGSASVAPVRPAEADEQDTAPQLSDDELVEAVRRWAADEVAMPSRERIRVRYAIGTGRADRVRAAALTGQTGSRQDDEPAAVGSA